MQSTCDVLDEWKSLYTEEIQNIWNTERKELRKAAMVFHVLKQEFARVESNLSREMDNFRQKIKLTDNLKNPNLPASSESSTPKPLQTQITNPEESQLRQSPKLNKYRKSSHVKKPISSPSLLDIQKENKNNKNSAAVPKIHHRTESEEELFDSFICDSPFDTVASEDLCIENKPIKSDICETPQGIKRLASVDVVDSSIIIEDTPNDSTNKKLKRTRKHSILRERVSKAPTIKEKKSFTLTQMFDNFPNQKIKVTAKSSDKKSSVKQTTTVQNKPVESNLNDETFFALEEESHKDSTKKNIQPRQNIPDEFFKDYDKFLLPKRTSPQHVHKTETVRRKTDRMKLPGWSCIECEQFYKGLNLSPEELRKKMNGCSKHRNKFPLLDTTPSGYWDVALPFTQETIIE